MNRSREDATMGVLEITRENMFEPLLAADPSFRSRWTEFATTWQYERNPLLYIVLGSLAEHLLERLAAQEIEGFDAIFVVVERWFTDGDAYVREAASIGLLETLQNLSGGCGGRPLTVEPWLGHESKRWWERLNQFWE